MNDTIFNGAPRFSHNRSNYAENMNRPSSQPHKVFNPSIYERALTKEFLNDKMAYSPNCPTRQSVNYNLYDISMNQRDSVTVSNSKVQNEMTYTPVLKDLGQYNQYHRNKNPSFDNAYYPYKRYVIDSTEKSPSQSRGITSTNMLSVSPIKRTLDETPSKRYPIHYLVNPSENVYNNRETGRLTANDIVGSREERSSLSSNSFIFGNKPFVANAYKYPEERTTYSYAKDKGYRRTQESSTDIMNESTKPQSSINEQESRIRSSLRGSYNEEYYVPTGVPARLSMNNNLYNHAETKISSTSFVSNNRKDMDSFSYISKYDAKENITPLSANKKAPKFLNITEIGEAAAKERSTVRPSTRELRESVNTNHQSYSGKSSYDYSEPKSVYKEGRHTSGISEANFYINHKQSDPKPATFVAKIDPESLTITTIKTNRGEISPKESHQKGKTLVRSSSTITSGITSINNDKITKINLSNNNNHISSNNNKNKQTQIKVDPRMTPTQAKDIYTKIINKSTASFNPIKEKVISPNESFHIEGYIQSNKINQLNTNLTRQKYNFAEEEEEQTHQTNEQEKSLKHSKSAPKIDSKKIFDFQKPTNIEKSPSTRLSYHDTGVSDNNRSSVPISRNRSTSEEKYSPNKKPILQSIQEISQSVFQSTKNLMSKLIASRPRIKCGCSPYLKNDQESCPKAQKWLNTKYQISEFDYLKKTYEKILASQEIDPKSKKQIKLDILRTYPECKVFAQNSEGVVALERVLECYAKYDPQIGYVQGMNFLVAAILYHAEEYVAFWILILMFEKCEMRDIYMHNLPGLAKHSQIIDFLILNNLPDLYSHFCKNNIIVEMFCTEWVCGLFGSVIPIEKMGYFLDAFIDNGWPFFYKFILTLLRSFDKELRQAVDMSEIMLIFKNGINKCNNIASESNNPIKINWEYLIKTALKVEIDNSFIFNLHTNFDQTRKTFIFNPQS